MSEPHPTAANKASQAKPTTAHPNTAQSAAKSHNAATAEATAAPATEAVTAELTASQAGSLPTTPNAPAPNVNIPSASVQAPQANAVSTSQPPQAVQPMQPEQPQAHTAPPETPATPTEATNQGQPRKRQSKLALAYLLLVLLVWILGHLVAERNLLGLFLTYSPTLLWLLPAPVVIGWAIFRKKRFGMAIIAATIALLGTGMLQWNWQSPGDLRVLTYNTAAGQGTTPQTLAEQLKRTQADLMLLQEVEFNDSNFRAAFLRKMSGYQVAQVGNIMTLSKWPMKTAKAFNLPGSNRKVLLTRIDWKGNQLAIINTHLETVRPSALNNLTQMRRTRDDRNEQVKTLARIASQETTPLLLAGDLNTPPRGQVYRDLIKIFGADTFRSSGRGAGWTFPELRVRIDHQMTKVLKPTRARVLEDDKWTSDHRPLLVEYKARKK